jgi:hypothetical protein
VAQVRARLDRLREAQALVVGLLDQHRERGAGRQRKLAVDVEPAGPDPALQHHAHADRSVRFAPQPRSDPPDQAHASR